jgi:hypothetical protein
MVKIAKQIRAWIMGLSPLWSLTGQGAQPQETQLNIEVHICNYSTVSVQSTALAEQETATIFERIGVKVAWVTCSVAPREGVRVKEFGDAPPVFLIRLLSKSMADKLRAGADILGSARLSENDSFGVMGDVYADSARGLWHGKEFEVMLGRIIAHELGHLLLGKNGHSAVGIMQARLGRKDAEPAQQVATFFPSEAKRIRGQVIARMATRASSKRSTVSSR